MEVEVDVVDSPSLINLRLLLDVNNRVLDVNNTLATTSEQSAGCTYVREKKEKKSYKDV